MDWSLVLVSQGIEVAVYPRSDGQAELRVPAFQLQSALSSIQAYVDENRFRRWQRPVPHAGWLFDVQSVAWVLLVAIFYLLQSGDHSPLLTRGALDTKAFQSGEWWRCMTATFLHADARHLSSNLSTGWMFLGVAMAEYGAGLALLGSALAGGFANVVGWGLRPGPFVGLGASGVVMAALGMVAVRGFRWREWRDRPRLATARGFIAGLLLFVLFGFSPQGDWLVHAAGFAIGAGLGWILNHWARSRRVQMRWDLTCKWLFIALVSACWWLALR